LSDLADIDPVLGSGEVDQDAVLSLAGELSLGWLAGSTTVRVAGQTTAVPNVSDPLGQKLLLHGAAVSPCVTPLSVHDVDQLLDHIPTAHVTRSHATSQH